jgi:hypothetical protein
MSLNCTIHTSTLAVRLVWAPASLFQLIRFTQLHWHIITHDQTLLRTSPPHRASGTQ